MKRHDTAILACKLLAVWLFAQGAILGVPAILSGILAAMAAHPNNALAWRMMGACGVLGIGVVIVLVLATFFWKKSDIMANRMVGGHGTSAPSEEIDALCLLSIGVVVVGTLSLQSSVSNVFGSIVVRLSLDASFSEFRDISQWWGSLFANAFRIALCAFVISRSRWIAAFLVHRHCAGAPRAA